MLYPLHSTVEAGAVVLEHFAVIGPAGTSDHIESLLLADSGFEERTRERQCLVMLPRLRPLHRVDNGLDLLIGEDKRSFSRVGVGLRVAGCRGVTWEKECSG